jgi:hypothetical protein
VFATSTCGVADAPPADAAKRLLQIGGDLSNTQGVMSFALWRMIGSVRRALKYETRGFVFVTPASLMGWRRLVSASVHKHRIERIWHPENVRRTRAYQAAACESIDAGRAKEAQRAQ